MRAASKPRAFTAEEMSACSIDAMKGVTEGQGYRHFPRELEEGEFFNVAVLGVIF